jgi:glycine/D-amino acid oxidase-like deaminating enzyme
MTTESKGRHGLPVPNPTTSYWQASFRDSPVHNHGHDDPLPSEECVADIVIIGSGISGAVSAYVLQQEAPHLSIVMVEAREACSGATGRNGGHCRPDSFLGFEEYSRIVGKDQAHKVLVNEWDTFNYIRDTIETEKIDCDWWQGLTMSVFLDDKIMQRARRNFQGYSEYADVRPGVRFVGDAQEAKMVRAVMQSSLAFIDQRV